MVAEEIIAVLVPAQHMYKIKPIKIPANTGNGLQRSCPFCSSNWWVIVLRERSYCLSGRLPYLCGMVSTSWVLGVDNNDNKKIEQEIWRKKTWLFKLLRGVVC